MRYRTVLLGTFLALLLAGCATYYRESNLNALPLGVDARSFALNYQQRGKTKGAVLRASKIAGSDTIQVFTLPMLADGAAKPTEYWFVFKNDRLMQWGRPEDWKNVAATYQIDFNPGPSVRPPI